MMSDALTRKDRTYSLLPVAFSSIGSGTTMPPGCEREGANQQNLKAVHVITNALSSISTVAVGVSTLFAGAADYSRTASTAYESPASRQQSTVNEHFAGILEESDMIRSINGLSMAVFHKIWDLSPLLIQYEALEPGFQLSEDGSLIFALGTKGSSSVMLEYFYDSEAKSFEDEVSFVGRKHGKLTADVLQKDSIPAMIAGFLG